MSKYKVDICGINSSSIKSCSNKENLELFKKMKSGDVFARNDLVKGNLKLVLSTLKRFNNKTDNLDDLFQVGCIGLIKAIDNFDLSYNVHFSTYAVPMIIGEVKRYIRDNSSLRISRSLKDLAYHALMLIDEKSQNGNGSIDYDEIARELEVSPYDLACALSAMKDPISMYEPVYNDGGDTIYLYDQIADKNIDSDFSHRLAIDAAQKKLDSREQFILDQRFVMGKTQMEVANELNISQAQISRLEKKAVKELKKVL